LISKIYIRESKRIEVSRVVGDPEIDCLLDETKKMKSGIEPEVESDSLIHRSRVRTTI
jgi:hypothetical protein